MARQAYCRACEQMHAPLLPCPPRRLVASGGERATLRLDGAGATVVLGGETLAVLRPGETYTVPQVYADAVVLLKDRRAKKAASQRRWRGKKGGGE